MNKNLLGVIITVIAIAGVVGIVMANNKDDETPSSAQTSSDMSSDMEMSNAGSNSTANKPSAPSTEVQSGTVEMDIKDFAFSKESIKVKKGTKVVWTNRDSAKHDVTPEKESEAFKASELLAMGQSYEFTFNTVGTYAYKCSPHPYMKASVEVVE